MDVCFCKNGYEFNVRCSCIIKDKKHENIILTNMRDVKDHEAFLLPGGRIEVLENLFDGIKREINEELGIELDYKLISVQENISKNKKFHMIEFVFYAEIDNFGLISSLDDGWDKFKIVAIKEIEKYDIRPKAVKKLVDKNTYDSISYNINYDWY